MPPIALLAGGLATRLRPIALTLPKSMVMVADRPFIAHQLELIRRNGITDVVICCGYLGEQIEQFVGNGEAFGCRVQYSYDGTPLKGTGGALRKALPLLSDTFFVMYGDSYLLANFAAAYEAFRASGQDGLMTVYRNEDQWDTSNVEFVDGKILEYNKVDKTPAMRYIDYGLGIFRSDVFSGRSEDEVFDLATVYRELLAHGQLAAFEVDGRFYEIGTASGLAETDALLRSSAQPHLN